MPILGIIGGVAPASTVAYYQQLVQAYRERVADGSYPRLIINSIDLAAMLRHVEADDHAGWADFLSVEIDRLHRAGASLALIASNTPHIIFDELQRRSPIPLISIVEATARKAESLGLKRPGLFGSGFTMRSPMYPDAFRRRGMEVSVPTPAEQDFIHKKYMGELVLENFRTETRAQMFSIVDAMIARHSIDGLILGGTELPLLLTGAEHRGIPLLDTTAIHVESAIVALASPENTP
ncbi:MAG: aspartate/glutamate racemase family protein [Acidobacteriaceae bacterium]